jgi:hypothetical protein
MAYSLPRSPGEFRHFRWQLKANRLTNTAQRNDPQRAKLSERNPPAIVWCGCGTGPERLSANGTSRQERHTPTTSVVEV